MKHIIFLIVFSFQFLQAQTVESKIKIACQCKPIAYYPEIENEKLYFTKLVKGEYSENLFLFVYEKIGNIWIQISEFKIDDETDFYELQPIETETVINQTKYFYSVYSLDNMGTAYYGRERYMFVFQEMTKSKNPIIIYFEKWASENGYYEVKGQKDIEPYKAFLKKCSEFVDKKFPAISEDIDIPENFSTKWEIENNSVYKSIVDQDINIEINFVEFDGNSFYNNYKHTTSEELKSTKYLVLGGFASPIIVYNIQSKKSQVVFIPEGWPNGGGWGVRSYYLKSINGDILTIASEDNYLKIDLAKKTLNVTKK